MTTEEYIDKLCECKTVKQVVKLSRQYAKDNDNPDAEIHELFKGDEGYEFFHCSGKMAVLDTYIEVAAMNAN